MAAKKIESLVDFIGETESIGLSADLTLFRGQAFKGGLLPAVARKDPSVNTVKLEKAVLQQLSLQGASFLSQAGTTDLDLLIAAQHFGLKTRLLDWTSNPLVALWFACTDRVKGDTYVYALEADDLLEKDIYSKDPFATAKTRVIQPRLNNPRITAQNGWFTLHRYSGKAKRFVPLGANPEAKKFIHELRIPEKSREGIIHSLDKHGVTYSTLFPDLAGLCSHLNWKHGLV